LLSLLEKEKKGDHLPAEPAIGEHHGADVCLHGAHKRCVRHLLVSRGDSAEKLLDRGTLTEKFPSKRERETKNKHLTSCADQRLHFTPSLCCCHTYSVGQRGRLYHRHLAAVLSAKWHRPYSIVCSCILISTGAHKEVSTGLLKTHYFSVNNSGTILHLLLCCIENNEKHEIKRCVGSSRHQCTPPHQSWMVMASHPGGGSAQCKICHNTSNTKEAFCLPASMQTLVLFWLHSESSYG
jgi:hypothetical protein